jgi:hypothetical protein
MVILSSNSSQHSNTPVIPFIQQIRDTLWLIYMFYTIEMHTMVSPFQRYLLIHWQQHINKLINWVLTPLSAVFRLYHGDQFLEVEEAGVPGENNRPWASNW